VTVQDEEAVEFAVNQANHEIQHDGVQGFPSQTSNLGQRTDDPEAPYGRTKNGQPRRKPGPQKGTRVGGAIPKPERRAATGRTASAKKGGTDYYTGILGLLQIPAMGLAAAGQFNEDFALDGAALSMHAPGIASALNDLANDNPAVGAALERIMSVGPYGAILGAMIPLAMQIAANHKAVPDAVARGAGAMPREEFRAALISQSAG
jgi:hypothetical protein